MLVVMALGTAALLPSGQPPDAEAQRLALGRAAAAVAEVARHHDVVVTHGSAAQVGLFAYQDALLPGVADSGLDVLSAQVEGSVGYLLQQALANEVRERDVVTLLTQIVVSPSDPAFHTPEKRVGPLLAEVDAQRLATEHGWTIVPEGSRYRRVVPSPEPLALVERRSLEALVAAGAVVICAGGGGIPVTLDPDGSLRGVDAVIDKDLSAALIATLLGADLLLLLTDVPAVSSDWGSAFARPIHRAAPRHLRSVPFAAGSMAPKIAAACRFVERTGKRAAIGTVADIGRLVHGDGGTQVTGDALDLTWHGPHLPFGEGADEPSLAAPLEGANN
jgi:carbamate kinase